MRISFMIENAGRGAVGDLQNHLRRDPRLRGARLTAALAAPEPGTLGAVEVLEFIGQDVLLPVALQMVYDWCKERTLGRRGNGMKVVVTRADHPDGSREARIELEGTVDDLIKALSAGMP